MSDDSKWIDDLYAEGQDEMPPTALDQQIRASARKELKRPWYGNTGRLASLATAASLVIAAMVIYFVPDETQQALDDSRTDVPSELKLNMPAKRQAESSAHANASADADSASETYVPELRQAAPASAPAAASFSAAREEAQQKVERQRESVPELSEESIRETLAEAEPAGRLAARAPEDATADIEEDLAERCGPLPGSQATRSLATDAIGWYLTVADGNESSDTRYWRCQDGAWIEIDRPTPVAPKKRPMAP